MADFFEILDYCIDQKLFSNRVKSFIAYYQISNIDQLNEFLNNPEDIIRTRNYGLKTIEDLKLFKKCLEDDTLSLIEDAVYHDNPFLNSIYHLCAKNHMNARALNFIIKNQIVDLEELNYWIEEALDTKKIESIGSKTIHDLRFIQYNLIASESGIDQVYTALRKEMLLNLGFVVNNLEFLKQASEHKLDVADFILHYFDEIFHQLAKSSKTRIKVIFSLPISMEESEKYNTYTKERLRQINKILEGIEFNQFKEKLNFLISYASVDYKFINPIHFIEPSDFGNNFVIHKFIYHVANCDNYYLYNIRTHKYETLNLLDTTNHIAYIQKSVISSDEILSFEDKLGEVAKSKYYSSVLLDDLFFNSHTILESLFILLNKYISINALADLLTFDNTKIHNNKKPTLASLLEKYLSNFDAPQSIKDIKSHCNTLPDYQDVDEEFVRYTMLRNKDTFYNIGKTGFYGLNLQGELKVKSFKDETIKFLRNNPGPKHKSALVQYFKTKNTKTNVRTIEEIIRMYDCFKSIGQSFFVLSEDDTIYETPLHWKKFYSKMESIFKSTLDWAPVTEVFHMIDSIEMPLYQNRAYKSSFYFIHNELLTEYFDFTNIENFKTILNDHDLGIKIKRGVRNFNDINDLDLKIITERHINTNYSFTLNSDELVSSIKYHIKLKQLYGI
jgi:hypothetical protein